jgi:sugar phosphate isomerase/epimerase
MLYTASFEEPVRRASVEATVSALKAAKELGITRVVLHPSYFIGLGMLDRELSKKLAGESLDTFVQAADGLDIVVCLENLFPEAHNLIEVREFHEVLDRYPQLMITLDTGHANIGAHPNRSFEFIELFFDRIGHVHLSDNSGRGDEHLPLGAGNVPIKKIIKGLKLKGYDKTMTLEVFSPDRDYVRMSLEKAREWWELI